jgi:hypothetical protein
MQTDTTKRNHRTRGFLFVFMHFCTSALEQKPVIKTPFETYDTALHRYANTIVKNNSTAKETVQNVLLHLWEK